MIEACIVQIYHNYVGSTQTYLLGIILECCFIFRHDRSRQVFVYNFVIEIYTVLFINVDICHLLSGYTLFDVLCSFRYHFLKIVIHIR